MGSPGQWDMKGGLYEVREFWHGALDESMERRVVLSTLSVCEGDR